MPTTFTRTTMIQEGWRCNQDLRLFFEQEIGKQFHFNQFMRTFIKTEGVGQTLQAAIDGWIESKKAPKGSSKIGKQFQYNQFTRQFFLDNPNATRQDAIAAWNNEKSQRK